ncbi:MAG: hypothetical protein DSY42_04450 [Aquifex sp.]|nr:MAG: hypothetical protein DSY42_04450 [Aquifex sp.]
MTKYQIAKKTGISVSHIISVLNGKEYASLEKAVEIEIATGGKYKVEDLVRPEVAEALRKFLALRCPILRNFQISEDKQSVKKEEKTTVGGKNV